MQLRYNHNIKYEIEKCNIIKAILIANNYINDNYNNNSNNYNINKYINCINKQWIKNI